MDAHPVRASLRERLNKLVRILDHHVAVDRQPGHLAQRFQHRSPNRQIGHKMPIHNVEVDDSSATRLGSLNLIRQMGEIRRQNRWKQLDQDGKSVSGRRFV